MYSFLISKFSNCFFQDVVFPSITVCNLNQLEASFLMDINAYGNLNKTNDLLDEFIFGYRGNVSEEHMKNVEEVKDYVNWWNQFGSSNFSWLSFSHLSSQKCENLFISMSFRGNTAIFF